MSNSPTFQLLFQFSYEMQNYPGSEQLEVQDDQMSWNPRTCPKMGPLN